MIGAEDRAKGADVDLGPTVNIVRDPRWGRAFESYSEDPYLAGRMGAADVEGVQSQGVMAQVKHWAVYNQETGRNTPADDAVIDDRTVHEIYTSAFGAIVEQARPASAMCSYSSINGTYACENAYLDHILKQDFGFDGFLTSDWGGTHSTAGSANAGMDLEMPGQDFFGSALKTAVRNGQVPPSRLDDMVGRILREEFRFGLFEHPSPDTPDAPASTPAHLDVARKAAEDGTVLLKNDGGLLPLDPAKVHSVAVIGDGAGKNTLSAGGGSAHIAGTGTVTPFDGIKARAGAGVQVDYAQGYLGQGSALPAIGSQYLAPPSGAGPGLLGQYYPNTDSSGPPALTRTDPQVDFTWTGAPPAPGLPSTGFSTKWTGTLTPPATGTYTLGLTSDDGSRLLIGGKPVIDNWGDHAAATKTAQVALTAGRPVPVEVDYYQGGGDSTVTLGWLPPGQDLTGEAAALAAKSDVAVVYANDFESEGSDLTDLDLPAGQDELIDAVAAANPNTVVVLNTGSAVTMPWLAKVKGVFEAWYPGQESGNAIAALLFGDVAPSGKLPVTFPASLGQVPASAPQQWPGAGGEVRYSEGLDVGYRWYDRQRLAPLYPFGYGLSYTSFRFSNLQVDPTGLGENGRLEVSADVTDTGARAGSEVAQLYLGDPAATGEPASQLKGFQKVALQPHQTKRVRFALTARDASYWSSEAQAWELGAGRYTVRVGDSSRNLPLSGEFRVDRTSGPRFTKVTAPAITPGGTTFAVTTGFTNGATEPVRDAVTALSLPKGWTAAPRTPAAFRTVRSGQTVSTTWSVTAAPTAAPGPAGLTATTRYAGGSTGPGSTAVQVSYPDLAAAYTDVGVTDDANPAPGDFDGAGFSFSAQALASAGISPGRTVVSGSAEFTWPDVPAGRADTVTAAGQSIALSGSGPALSFLAAGTHGTQRGPVTVTYTDGTTSTSNLTVADWYSDRAVEGCVLVATAPYWNRPPGSTYPHDQEVSLYSASIPLTAGKPVAFVTLPVNRQLHVFATAFSGA